MTGERDHVLERAQVTSIEAMFFRVATVDSTKQALVLQRALKVTVVQGANICTPCLDIASAVTSFHAIDR